MAHIAQLDASDQLVAGSLFGLPAHDFQDIYADAAGGVVLVSRDAQGGSAADHNCGNVNNLCGTAASLPTTVSCMDMYLVRFDGSKETWAQKLTETSASPSNPAYGTSPTAGSQVVFIWGIYQHAGRIAFDGSNYAAYYGAAITVPNQACVQSGSVLPKGVNIHQGDRMSVVSSAGALQTNGGFHFGCSHSGYERMIWDAAAKKFVTVCVNDATVPPEIGRLALAPNAGTIISTLDLTYADFGSVLVAGGGGYWAITSNRRPGQPASTDNGGTVTYNNGLADIDLLHFTTGMADRSLTVASDTGLNDRAPHLAAFGTNRMLAAWETGSGTGDIAQGDTSRKLYVQPLNATTGAAEGPAFNIAGVVGSRYQDFRSFPDGSVAYPAPGSSSTKIKIVRVLPCP
jgi:hypothetical protein